MDGTLALKKYNVLGRLEALEEGGSYVLPVASDETLGGVKIGEGLDIDENGVLSASVTPYTPPDYSTSEVDTGMKWIDGKTIYRKVIVLAEAISINANTWTSGIDFTADKIIDVRTYYSVDNNLYPVGGNIANDKLLILNIRNSAITVDTIIVEYTKTEVTKKKK